jgi:hypothetical protein
MRGLIDRHTNAHRHWSQPVVQKMSTHSARIKRNTLSDLVICHGAHNGCRKVSERHLSLLSVVDEHFDDCRLARIGDADKGNQLRKAILGRVNWLKAANQSRISAIII